MCRLATKVWCQGICCKRVIASVDWRPLARCLPSSLRTSLARKHQSTSRLQVGCRPYTLHTARLFREEGYSYIPDWQGHTSHHTTKPGCALLTRHQSKWVSRFVEETFDGCRNLAQDHLAAAMPASPGHRNCIAHLFCSALAPLCAAITCTKLLFSSS